MTAGHRQRYHVESILLICIMFCFINPMDQTPSCEATRWWATHEISVCISHIFHACYITFPHHVPWFNHRNSISSTQYGHKKQTTSSQTNWQLLKLSDNSYWAAIRTVKSSSRKLIGLNKEKSPFKYQHWENTYIHILLLFCKGICNAKKWFIIKWSAYVMNFVQHSSTA